MICVGNWDKTPQYLDSLFAMISVCCFQFRCLSIVTPRKLKESTPSISSLFNISWWVTWLISLWHGWKNMYLVFSCDHASSSMNGSVRPSVCPSVTPFSPCSHHRIIMKFAEVITNDSDVHAKGQGQRSKVKVTEVTTQLNRFGTVTPVWIHIWWWNDTYSLMLLRRGALLFFKVICQISRSQGAKTRQIWPTWGVSGL